MGSVVVDTSVVIGLVRTADAHHHRVVDAIRAAAERNDGFVLPASVLAESLVGSHRAGEAAEMCRDLIGIFGPVRIVDEAVAWETSALRARRPSVRLPDALVVATGIVDDATVLTCDKRLAGVDPRVQVLS